MHVIKILIEAHGVTIFIAGLIPPKLVLRSLRLLYEGPCYEHVITGMHIGLSGSFELLVR